MSFETPSADDKASAPDHEETRSAPLSEASGPPTETPPTATRSGDASPEDEDQAEHYFDITRRLVFVAIIIASLVILVRSVLEIQAREDLRAQAMAERDRISSQLREITLYSGLLRESAGDTTENGTGPERHGETAFSSAEDPKSLSYLISGRVIELKQESEALDDFVQGVGLLIERGSSQATQLLDCLREKYRRRCQILRNSLDELDRRGMAAESPTPTADASGESRDDPSTARERNEEVAADNTTRAVRGSDRTENGGAVTTGLIDASRLEADTGKTWWYRSATILSLIILWPSIALTLAALIATVAWRYFDLDRNGYPLFGFSTRIKQTLPPTGRYFQKSLSVVLATLGTGILILVTIAKLPYLGSNDLLAIGMACAGVVGVLSNAVRTFLIGEESEEIVHESRKTEPSEEPGGRVESIQREYSPPKEGNVPKPNTFDHPDCGGIVWAVSGALIGIVAFILVKSGKQIFLGQLDPANVSVNPFSGVLTAYLLAIFSPQYFRRLADIAKIALSNPH